MSDDMTKKYQKHYNQLISDTLNDLLIKNISFQANIKLANEIISEQEETIKGLNETLDSTKSDLENTRKVKTDNSNTQIASLENRIKSLNDTITKLNSDLNIANRVKIEYDNLKTQVSQLETFRGQLLRERESHQKTKDDLGSQINDLNRQLEELKSPPKKKKAVKSTVLVETPAEKEQEIPPQDVVKDGGSF